MIKGIHHISMSGGIKKGKFVYKNQESLKKMHAFYDKTRICTIHGGNGITTFSTDMAQDVYENSQDTDTRRFVPDEVYDSVEEARKAIEFLMSRYDSADGPFGYHIAKDFTGKGYATEAVNAFLPVMVQKLNLKEVSGICLAENTASVRVLEKCEFTRIYKGLGNYQGKEVQIVKSVWMFGKIKFDSTYN